MLVAILVFGRPTQLSEMSPWLICPAVGLISIAAAIAYEVVAGRIETSPNGIACYSLGYHLATEWTNISRIEVSPDGIARLVLRKKPKRIPGLFGFVANLGPDGMIQLSSYIDAAATSGLLVQIKRYAPHLDVDSLVLRDSKWKPYQRPLAIGTYLLVCMILLVPLAVLSRNLVRLGESAGFSNVDLIARMTTSSVMIAVVASGLGLLSLAKELRDASPREIERAANGYYLAPIVGLLGGLLVAVLAVMACQLAGYEVDGRLSGSLGIINILLGVASPLIGAWIARRAFGRMRG